MRSTRTKLTIRHVEVEGSADTISGVLKSCGDLFFPDTSETGDQNVRIRRVRKSVQTEPKAEQ